MSKTGLEELVDISTVTDRDSPCQHVFVAVDGSRSPCPNRAAWQEHQTCFGCADSGSLQACHTCRDIALADFVQMPPAVIWCRTCEEFSVEVCFEPL